MNRQNILCALLIFFGCMNAAHAGEAQRFSGTEPVFSLNPVTDGILLGGGILLTGGDFILDSVLELNRQEYDGTFYDKDDVNPFDRAFMHGYSKTADTAADIVLAATLATPLVLATTGRSEWLTCAVLYAETILIANGIKELTKLCVNRTRPYMYYDDWPEADVDSGDFANSFPSGHTTMSFAAATFTTYTFWSYFPKSKWKIPVAALSYSLAAGTSALRIASGNHFMTDVLAGAAIGTLTGFVVPWLHTFNSRHSLNIGLLPRGISFSMLL